MRVIVLGAGLLGVTSAWYLAEAGHEVTVIDRQPGVALETSFANGGQISTCHAEPWANPSAPWQVLKWLGHEDSPLLWRLRADPAQWAWGLRFLHECLPHCTRANIAAIMALALYSREQLGILRGELGLSYDALQRGILHFYTDQREFEHALPQAALMRQFGCERIPKRADECLQIEPALKYSTQAIVGGTYTREDESGDAHQFVQSLAKHCVTRGVEFRYEHPIAALDMQGGRVAGLRMGCGSTMQADRYVVALGSFSPLLLRTANLNIPVYPAKGYSVTIPVAEQSMAPTVSLTDDGHKIVFSRLGERLRVAGTAEFCGYDTTINQARCAAILKRVSAIFPQISQLNDVTLWTGLRPATPGNVPLVCKTKFDNLYLNTGHGTLGWTMACGSGKLLADLVAGCAPDLNPAPYALL